VVGYDDGGMVGDDALNTMQSLDFSDARDDATAQPAAYTPPTDATQPGFYIDPTQNISSQVGGEATPAPTSGNAGASASGRASTPPPDPTTAEIHDGQGNPSKGLISAIGDGLHWLGAHLGLTPAGQQQPAVAANPQQQDQRQQFIQHSPDGATYMSAKDAAELDKINDPDGNLSNAYRNIARLEGGYKWALQNGDSAMAGRMAASILHYSVMTSQQLSAQAQKALYDGDLQKTVQYINEASDAVPDGRLVHATLSPDGKSVTFQNKDLDGRVIWQQTGAAHEVLERATAMGKDGKLQWNALESQAAKYDSTFADMQKARQGNAVAGAKEDAANAEAEREATVFSKMHPSAAPAATPTTPALPGPGNSGTTITASNTPLGPEGGGAPAPAPTSATAGATPSPNSAGAAQPNAAPQTADENQGQGPTVANANKGAGLPPPPTSPADIPSPDAQNTDLERPEVEQANRVSIRNGIVSNFKPTSPEPEVMARPDTVPEYAGLTPQGKVAAQKAYQESFAAHKAWEADQNNALRGQIASADKDYTDGLNSRRQAAAMAHSDTAREQTQTHADEAAATRAKAQQDFETKKEQSTREWEVTKPRDPRDVEKTFIDPTTNTSKAPEYMANALGLVKPDGTADVQSLNAKLDRSQQAIMGKAIASAYHFSPDSSPEEISDLVTGIVTNPKYMATPEQLSPDQTYGIPRALIRVDRGDGTSGSMAIPEEDLRNLKALAKTYGAAHPTPPPPKSGVPAAPGVNNYPAPTAPVRMTPRGPVAAPPPAFVPHPAIPRGPSGGTGYGGPRPGMLPPQQLPNG
jgi:hypothetical protein